MTTLIKKLAAVGAVAALAGVAVVAPLTQTAHAADTNPTQATQTVNVIVAPSLTINNQTGTDTSMSAVNIDFTTAPTTGEKPVASPSPVKVLTNNAKGYKAYLTIDSQEEDPTTTNPNKATPALVRTGATGTVQGIDTLTSGSGASLAVNTWAAKSSDITGNASAWTTVPLSGDAFVLANHSGPSASTGDSITATFGANVNSATAAGTYTNIVLYTAVANS